jgi:DNA-binding NtrC family response regulator
MIETAAAMAMTETRNSAMNSTATARRRVLVLGGLATAESGWTESERVHYRAASDAVDALTQLRMSGRSEGREASERFEAFLISGLDEASASQLVADALRLNESVALIVHAPELDDDAVVRLIHAGAFDVWRERLEGDALTAKLERSLGFWRARLAQQAHSIDDAREPWRRMLVGQSRAMQQVGPRRSTVLIAGETGTGKEMVARALHLASDRRHQPMVAVNCSALPENLLEAELFGHVKGAFTGAFQSRAGRFEQANRGTIFLDEIAELPLDLQAKLLRVLQEREFQRLGSSETVKVDVRVIAACNVDLLARVQEGRFREDLYYRVNVVPLTLAPLRERRGDVPLLALHFVEKICRAEQVRMKQLSREALERLERYDWPGNVRQLENAIEMAIALSGDRTALHPGDFPLPEAQVRPGVQRAASHAFSVMPNIALPEQGMDYEATLGRLELSILGQAMERAGGNKTVAAEMLRLKRTTLAAKLRSLGEQSRTWAV